MADYGLRNDGTKKDTGYFGALKNKHGETMTEYSVGVELDGHEAEIPTIVPTLTSNEIKQLLNLSDGDAVPDSIMQKAIDHAILRKRSGRSVFADADDKALQKDMRKLLGLEDK